MGVVTLTDAEVADTQADLDNLRKKVSKLLKERDKAEATVEQLQAMIALQHRTLGYMPIVGIMCDRPNCKNAIAIVGAKAIDHDDVTAACYAVAKAQGWSITQHTHACAECRKG